MITKTENEQKQNPSLRRCLDKFHYTYAIKYSKAFQMNEVDLYVLKWKWNINYVGRKKTNDMNTGFNIYKKNQVCAYRVDTHLYFTLRYSNIQLLKCSNSVKSLHWWKFNLSEFENAVSLA